MEGADKKALNCFPDLEKTKVPSSVVLKAGISIQKRLSKLSAARKDLEMCEQADVVTQTLGLFWQDPDSL